MSRMRRPAGMVFHSRQKLEAATSLDTTQEGVTMIRPRSPQASRPAGLRLCLLAACLLASCSGCLIPMYSGDPIRRARELIYTSEDLRAITDEWERIWFLDQPSHMKPYRTHGGIL